MDRRTFLFGSLAFGVRNRAQTEPIETFSQWLNASPELRRRSLEALSERVRALDRRIHAWVQLLPQAATGSGALEGIPFGAKDIIETKGLSTEYGSAIYKGRIGTADAAIVRMLRDRGAVLLGKTHTTAFAYREPAPTRNPHDLAHTPGGSSSGSAAAVAARMIPLAIGTQTGGSTIRPASYCGVTGFKPTYGLLSIDGVLPFAKSLDTLGFFTHTAADMLAFWLAIGQHAGTAQAESIGVIDPLPDVDAAMAAAFRNTVARLQAAGWTVRPVGIASDLRTLRDVQRTVMFYEGARFHEERFNTYGSRMAQMGELVRDGLQITDRQYDTAVKTIGDARERFTNIFETTPVIVSPAATGQAPLGLSNTGDSSMNAPWTALGTPAITIPMAVTGLPLGLQLTADRGQDGRLLYAAVRLQQALK